MVVNNTVLNVCDNSGILYVKCFNLTKYVCVGVEVYSCVKLRKSNIKLKKVDVLKGIIVRLKKNTPRNIGFYIAFASNDIVLLNEKNEFLGTRIFGPLPLELRKRNFLKLLSLACIFI